jgi:hypothetical protein
MTEVEQAVIKTLAYGAVFEYPLKAAEINKYLILNQKTPPRSPFRPPSGESLRAGITGLVESGRVGFREGYYFLKGREKTVTQRKERIIISAEKMKIASEVANKLAKIPLILGIFITGTLSMNNASESDDIDLMIITKANRLWTTRLLVTAYLEILGIRRRPMGKTVDKVCANMYLDETALALPKNKQNLYTAHEVIQVKPLINKERVYERFRQANLWTSEYVRTERV